MYALKPFKLCLSVEHSSAGCFFNANIQSYMDNVPGQFWNDIKYNYAAAANISVTTISLIM